MFKKYRERIMKGLGKEKAAMRGKVRGYILREISCEVKECRVSSISEG